jgi:uncharacterized protein with PIN domain
MPPSFAVEKTLGRLGKWLRLMGFDTIAETEFPKGVFRAHIDAGRIFLTRTQRALRIPAPFRMIFIQANDPFEQLAEVVGKATCGPFRAACGATTQLLPFPRMTSNV